jgi:hypothetical protein
MLLVLGVGSTTFAQGPGGRGNDGNRVNPPGSNLPPASTIDAATEAALIEAINDEYKAHEVYRKVIDTFGAVRPFTNIMRAEEQHIAALEVLFNRYNLAIPVNDWYDRVPAFGSVTEACAAGVQAEIDNAALYDRIFATVSAPDVIQVFTSLRDASQYNHLPAFERCSSGESGQGAGYGANSGQGAGQGSQGQGYGQQANNRGTGQGSQGAGYGQQANNRGQGSQGGGQGYGRQANNRGMGQGWQGNGSRIGDCPYQ